LVDSILLRNIGSNIVGTILPAAAALVAVPLLVGHLGIGIFGIFSMQVAALFFFGLADFGISRAIVLLSFDAGFSAGEGWLRTYRIGLRFSAVLAAAVAILGLPVGAFLSYWHPTHVQGQDLALSTMILFLSAGLMLVSQAPRAVLEAQQRFLVANMIRGPSAAAIFLAPLVALSISNTLTSASISILLTRIVSAACYFWACGSMQSRLSSQPVRAVAALTDHELRLSFLGKAGWLGLTNMLSLLIAYLDRFILGALGSTAMVGQYVIAQEVVTKMWIASGAVISAAIPRLASQRETSQAAALRKTTRQLISIMWVVGVLPAAVLILFGSPILKLWLRGNFDPASVLPLQIMAAGLGVNNLTQINFSLLQVHGGEQRGAFLQVFHVLFLCVALAMLVPPFGINGVAIAFTARLLIDALLVRRLLSGLGEECRDIGVRHFALIGCGVFLLFLFFMA
jgi:O-antigen/teichoic acid export membrane protein